MSAIAISNNDVAFLAWKVDAKIHDCLGFAIYRKDSTGAENPLPAWVGFQGQSNAGWKANTTANWPVQKFTWRDLTAHHGETYTYRIVPLSGTPEHLVADTTNQLVTNKVTISEKCGDFSAFFNRGILSTQSLVHQIPTGPSGGLDTTKLLGRIDQPGDPLRNRLSGQLRVAMLNLFSRAKAEGGSLYLSLYELTDPELEQQLLVNKDLIHIILANTGTDDAENKPARQALHEAGVDITDRMVGVGHIAHNKFAVYVNAAGKPQAVWTGSTNWTDLGLCAQSNNGILIESRDLAALYLDYWKRMKADDSQQAADYRQANDQVHTVKADGDKTSIDLWFSPNTKQKSKTAKSAAPDDLKAVFAAMHAAKEAILFLVFQPGTPSIVDEAGKIQDANPGLFIHGAATDPKAVENYNTQLFHKSGKEGDADVVAVAAINDQFGFWERELLKMPGAHAIIHNKIVVIDPFSADCVVVTGSHNLGYRASYANDENLLIIRGNRALAESYAAHVMDVYDHYRWRFTLQRKGSQAWNGLIANDSWQDKYFMPDSESAREMDFWIPSGSNNPAENDSDAHAAKPRKHAPAAAKAAHNK